METHTIFYVRAQYGRGVRVDCAASWTAEDAEAFNAMRVAAKLEDRHLPNQEVIDACPGMARAIRAVTHMSLRRSSNNDVQGPYHLITDGPLTDDELVTWWRANHGDLR